MRSSRILTVTAAATMLALSGCAGGPGVDLDAAQAWADEVVAAESDGPGAAGAATMKVGPGERAGELFLNFEHQTALVRIDVRCYDGALDDVTATIIATVTSAGGEESTVEGDAPCDREPHEIALDAADAASLEIRATATTETYLHATVIQELVIERE